MSGSTETQDVKQWPHSETNTMSLQETPNTGSNNAFVPKFSEGVKWGTANGAGSGSSMHIFQGGRQLISDSVKAEKQDHREARTVANGTDLDESQSTAESPCQNGDRQVASGVEEEKWFPQVAPNSPIADESTATQGRGYGHVHRDNKNGKHVTPITNKGVLKIAEFALHNPPDGENSVTQGTTTLQVDKHAEGNNLPNHGTTKKSLASMLGIFSGDASHDHQAEDARLTKQDYAVALCQAIETAIKFGPKPSVTLTPMESRESIARSLAKLGGYTADARVTSTPRVTSTLTPVNTMGSAIMERERTGREAGLVKVEEDFENDTLSDDLAGTDGTRTGQENMQVDAGVRNTMKTRNRLGTNYACTEEDTPGAVALKEDSGDIGTDKNAQARAQATGADATVDNAKSTRNLVEVDHAYTKEDTSVTVILKEDRWGNREAHGAYENTQADDQSTPIRSGTDEHAKTSEKALYRLCTSNSKMGVPVNTGQTEERAPPEYDKECDKPEAEAEFQLDSFSPTPRADVWPKDPENAQKRDKPSNALENTQD